MTVALYQLSYALVCGAPRIRTSHFHYIAVVLFLPLELFAPNSYLCQYQFLYVSGEILPLGLLFGTLHFLNHCRGLFTHLE